MAEGRIGAQVQAAAAMGRLSRTVHDRRRVRRNILLAVLAGVGLAACGAGQEPTGITPSETADYSTGFGTEPTTEVADK